MAMFFRHAAKFRLSLWRSTLYRRKQKSDWNKIISDVERYFFSVPKYCIRNTTLSHALDHIEIA